MIVSSQNCPRQLSLSFDGWRLLGGFLTGIVLWLGCDRADAAPESTKLAEQVRKIFEQRCLACHGAPSEKVRGDLRILDFTALTAAERKLVVPGKPNESTLLERVDSNDDDLRMPPPPEKSLRDDERQLIRKWIADGAAIWNEPSGAPKSSGTVKPDPAKLAAQAKAVFRSHCFECHGATTTNAGIRILDHQSLVLKKKKVIPGRPEQSHVFRVITATGSTVMPPSGNPRLAESDIETVRAWIVAGAPPFPTDVESPREANVDPGLKESVGVEYVLKQILQHVGSLPAETRPFVRFFSVNHLLGAGASRADLDLHRDALAKAINHLSLEPQIVVPVVVDAPLGTLFAVDIRKLGWHRQPLQRVPSDGQTSPSGLTVFDLAVLEYPYGILYEDSDLFRRVLDEFVTPAKIVRPVPYLRADWFVSVATQPPLYEDFLQLPFELNELEKRLGVDSAANVANHTAQRAGMIVSGVSRNNRVVERHSFQHGAYWKSFDFATSKGRENMFLDPIHLNPAGGEMIFNLPNGLQGYLLALANGRRLDEAPTSIVTDKFAEDKTVRNGLACMRCHDSGMKGFADTVRVAVEKLPGSPGFSKRDVLALYPPSNEMDELLRQDTERFLTALEKALGKPQQEEPLLPVSHRFLDAPLTLSAAASELGLSSADGLHPLFRSPQFVSLGLVALGSPGGIVRRDQWDEYFHQVVRETGLGIPVVPLDGLTRTDFPPVKPAFDVELTTNRKNNTFAPGDELVLLVTNRSKSDLHIELIGTGAKGEKIIVVPATTVVKAGDQFRFPDKGSIKVRPTLGKEQITLFACDQPFPAGELLRGQGTTDRVFHDFYRLKPGGPIAPEFDASRMVKRTLVIETK